MKNTLKTILFGALIAVMILPFSSMSVTHATAETADQFKDIKNMEDQIADTEKQISKLEKKISNTEKKLANLEKKISSIQDKLDNTADKREIKKLEKNLVAKLEKKIANLDANLWKLEEELQQLTREKPYDYDSLKKRVTDTKQKYKDELIIVGKESVQTKSDNNLDYDKDKIKRIIQRLDLVEAIMELSNWDNPIKMTAADLEKRNSLVRDLHQSSEEETKLKKNISISANSISPMVSPKRSMGTWDIIYHTVANGNVYCSGVPSSITKYEGNSDGYVEVYSTGSVFRNVWDYDTKIYKNSTQGCSNPPNDHYSNTLKVVDISGEANDCYISTTSPTGTTQKYCDGFDPWTITIIYTRGTYDNHVYLEKNGWGLGAILGL